jgi:hypothetical protein
MVLGDSQHNYRRLHCCNGQTIKYDAIKQIILTKQNCIYQSYRIQAKNRTLILPKVHNPNIKESVDLVEYIAAATC